MDERSPREKAAIDAILAIAADCAKHSNSNDFRSEVALLMGCVAGRIAAQFATVPIENAIELSRGVAEFLAGKLTESVVTVVKNRPANDAG